MRPAAPEVGPRTPSPMVGPGPVWGSGLGPRSEPGAMSGRGPPRRRPTSSSRQASRPSGGAATETGLRPPAAEASASSSSGAMDPRTDPTVARLTSANRPSPSAAARQPPSAERLLLSARACPTAAARLCTVSPSREPTATNSCNDFRWQCRTPGAPGHGQQPWCNGRRNTWCNGEDRRAPVGGGFASGSRARTSWPVVADPVRMRPCRAHPTIVCPAWFSQTALYVRRSTPATS